MATTKDTASRVAYCRSTGRFIGLVLSEVRRPKCSTVLHVASSWGRSEIFRSSVTLCPATAEQVATYSKL